MIRGARVGERVTLVGVSPCVIGVTQVSCDYHPDRGTAGVISAVNQVRGKGTRYHVKLDAPNTGGFWVPAAWLTRLRGAA